ncbi:MAG: hypothetical protein KJZ54_10130 [Phycisphaerales bacterium]|nr:hypothetical protein [Phycisphaerales bacterium]
MAGPGVLLVLLGAVVGIVLLVLLVMYVVVPIFKGFGWLVRHVFAFIGGEIRDALRLIGALVTAVVFAFLVIANVVIGRWSAAAHFGRAIQAEMGAGGSCIYRILVGHPARFLCLNSLVDGLERRLPEVVAAAPTADTPSRRTGKFEGYVIVGSLPGGGSGGKLYVAEPDEIRRAAFARQGIDDVDQVVIKSFSLQDGSSLPQIVRESRALDAAKKLGLVLDHELTPERFYYVMRYVPGEPLSLVTQKLHARAPAEGLTNPQLHEALGYLASLLGTLDRYHRGGLWHKDVKPDNIIVHGREAHLVDFGLLTPIRSAMTLTTHGTEYFRDPELVRMALRGVKVHQVDGAKFDVYAAGAVLYAVVENSFPAHGALSQISRRCPEAVRWIVRRAMADYDKRYPTAAAMLDDIRFVAAATDPFAVRPADLPSMRGVEGDAHQAIRHEEEELVFAGAVAASHSRHARPDASPGFAPAPPGPPQRRSRPRLRVTNWWSGEYVVSPDEPVRAAGTPRPHSPQRPARPRVQRAPAQQQLASARARVEAARTRAAKRIGARPPASAPARFNNGVNPGVAVALFLFLAACVGLVAVMFSIAQSNRGIMVSTNDADAPGTIVPHPPLPPPLPAFAPVPVEGARLLVVSDLLPPLDDSTRARIAAVLASFASTGVDILGAAADADAEADTADLDLAAAVRLVRGQSPLDSPDAAAAIESWLATSPDADAVLWLSPLTDGARSGPEARLFVAPRGEEWSAWSRSALEAIDAILAR